MKEQPRKEMHYGHEVMVNPTTESIRRNECLCLNCEALKVKPGQQNCPIAKLLYEICVKGNVAMIITRCPAWQTKTS